MGFRIKRMYDDHVGTLRAMNPTTGKVVWEHKEHLPLWAGVLATKGNLVFTGTGDGFFKAFDAKTGKELWKFQTGSGIVSPPITWEQDGEQYIGVTVGYGGAVPLWGGDMSELTKPVAQGGSFWVFKIPSWDNQTAQRYPPALPIPVGASMLAPTGWRSALNHPALRTTPISIPRCTSSAWELTCSLLLSNVR